MTELEQPDSVRTPGRTWTEFPEELGGPGRGTVAVTAPGTVEVRAADESDRFDRIDPEQNTVAARHADDLAAGNAVLVRVPSGVAVEEPVRIATELREGFFPHHVVVIVEDGAAAEVVERNQGSGAVDSSVVEVVVGADATLRYTKINDLDDATGYADCHARVAANGEVRWTVASTGADLYRNTVTTALEGRAARLDYRLGFLAARDQHLDHTATVVHAADDTRCDIEARGVALDRSRAVYKGVQEVAEGAEGTESFQDERTVLVGDDAEADTTPQLRIDNHDVEATHAATTGHVDEEDLFYMRSRGIAESAAKREIITGMFDDLFDAAPARLAVHRAIDAALAE
ncbi:MAG: SufD family Fe-S cluster assembly protein [Candidatus Nanohaloarchaea archaeon]|nr:SufD family Fe-S cluster assembly protein [Candidatus Nanohaloarchaea archaeon]